MLRYNLVISAWLSINKLSGNCHMNILKLNGMASIKGTISRQLEDNFNWHSSQS